RRRHRRSERDWGSDVCSSDLARTAAYNDALSELFLALPAMRRFEREWDIRTLPARHHTLSALLQSFQSWSGGRALPRIVILDWRDRKSVGEGKSGAAGGRVQR